MLEIYDEIFYRQAAKECNLCNCFPLMRVRDVFLSTDQADFGSHLLNIRLVQAGIGEGKLEMNFRKAEAL